MIAPLSSDYSGPEQSRKFAVKAGGRNHPDCCISRVNPRTAGADNVSRYHFD